MSAPARAQHGAPVHARAPSEEAPAALDPARWYYRYGYVALAHLLSRYHRTAVQGVLPPAGPCIYVTHHGAGYLTLDLLVACYHLGWAGWYARQEPHTPLRIVAAAGHALERALPGLVTAKRHAGLIAPDMASSLAVLARGEQLLVTPGGRREATPRARGYRLRWAERFGFVRLALATGAPIVPLAVVGGFAAFPGVAYGKYALWSPIPFPARLRIAIGAPIVVPRAPDRLRDPATVRPLHARAWAATQALYDDLLAGGAGR